MSNINITCFDENNGMIEANQQQHERIAAIEFNNNNNMNSINQSGDHHLQKAYFQMNQRFSSLQFTHKNSFSTSMTGDCGGGGGGGGGIVAISPPDSTMNLLNNNDSQSNLISIDAVRNSSAVGLGLLRRKSRLIRNATRLSPMFTTMPSSSQIITKRNSSVSTERSISLVKRQISNPSDVEFEIDNMIK